MLSVVILTVTAPIGMIAMNLGIQHNDIQHNDILYNDIQHNDIQHNDTNH